MVYHCYACKSFQLQPIGRITVKAKNNQIKYGTAPAEIISNKCWNCDTDLHIAGPTYNGPLHDKEFVKGMIKHVKDNKGKYGTEDRMVGMLSVIDEVKLYFTGFLKSCFFGRNWIHLSTITFLPFQVLFIARPHLYWLFRN